MTVIVRELIVRAVVEPEGAAVTAPAEATPRRPQDERRIVERCADEVFRILREKEER